MKLIAKLIDRINRLPLYAQGIMLGFAVFALAGGIAVIYEQQQDKNNAKQLVNSYQRWCEEFATRDDCSVALHDNIQCPYKKTNAFKVISLEQCKDFPEHYAKLDAMVKKAAETRKTTEQIRMRKMREQIRIAPNTLAPALPDITRE